MLISSIIPSAKAEVLIGSTTTATIAGSSWISEMLPIISTIGMIAGTLVAVHGLIKICYGYYILWRYKNNGNH